MAVDALARLGLRLRKTATDSTERGRGTVEHRVALVDRLAEFAPQLRSGV